MACTRGERSQERKKSNWLVLPLLSRAKSASFIALLPSTSSMKFTAHNRGNRTSWPVPEDYTLAAYFPSSVLGLNPIHSSKNWQWLVKITLAPLKTRKPEISVVEHVNVSLLHVGRKMDVPDQLPALLWAVFQDPASIQFTALLLSTCGFQGYPRGVLPASRWEKEEMERVCLILDPLFLQVTHVTSAPSLARPSAWPHLDVREAGRDVVVSQQQFYTIIGRTQVFDEKPALSITAH